MAAKQPQGRAMLHKIHSRLADFARNRKLRTKLLLSYFFVLLLPVLLVSNLLIGKIRETVLTQTKYINQADFDQLRDNVCNQLQNYLNISDNILSQTSYNEYLSTSFKPNNSILNVYSAFLKFQDAYTIMLTYNSDNMNVTFYSSNRSILFNKTVVSIDDSIEKQAWYQDTLKKKGGNLVDLGRDENGQGYNILISRTMIGDASNSYTNLFRIAIPETELYKLIKNESGNKNIYLINENNVVISATDRGSIGKSIENVRLFKTIEMGNGLSTALDMKDKTGVAYLSSFYNQSSINGWRLVSFVPSSALMKELDDIVRYDMVVSAVSVIITIVFVLFFSSSITKRLRLLTQNMNRIRDGYFDTSVDFDAKDEIGELATGFKSMVDRINFLIEEVYKAEIRIKNLTIKKKEAEIKALQSQINPHFLFNTMESIRMNLLKKSDFETSDVIQDFSKLLRTSIDWSQDMVPVRQEMNLVESYMNIQKYRFREKLNYQITLDESIDDYLIPKFTLQPLVENAIHHGLEPKSHGGMLKIYSVCTERDIRILVEDNGVGIDSHRLEQVKEHLSKDMFNSDDEQGSIGMANIHQRLRMHYGAPYGLDIESKQHAGTRVTIVLPPRNQEGF